MFDVSIRSIILLSAGSSMPNKKILASFYLQQCKQKAAILMHNPMQKLDTSILAIMDTRYPSKIMQSQKKLFSN